MNDSVDKIVKYFAAMTEQEFTYKEKRISPKPLTVSPLLLRDFSCPPNCGACCPVFTLDYLPTEQWPDSIEKRFIPLNGTFSLFRLSQQPFGRAWRLTKVDGVKGALCHLYNSPSGE